MMFIEKSTKWNTLSQKEVNYFEKKIREAVKYKVKMTATNYKEEQELVLKNKRLVVPRGTVVDALLSRLYEKCKGDEFSDILVKIGNYGLTFGEKDRYFLEKIYPQKIQKITD